MTNETKLHIAILKQTLALATSGFGLVAALAWNSVIQEIVTVYVKPYFPKESSLISLLLYAVVVTGIAVTITVQLAKIIRKLEGPQSLSADK